MEERLSRTITVIAPQVLKGKRTGPNPLSIPSLADSLSSEGRHSNPLQYSCSENLQGKGSWKVKQIQRTEL